MTVVQIVLREIKHRKVSFLISSLAVAAATLCFAILVGLLRAHDAETVVMMEAMETETRASMKQFEDDIRKSMKGLGFNIYIFPEGQELGEVYAQGYASKTMPEAYVERLANSKIVTVNHLLPTLTQKMKWPERARTVVLIGVRGEVPIAHRDPKKPLIDPVEAGKLVMGYELAASLTLKAGDTVTFMAQPFTIDKIHPERGSEDDITIWMNLEECQVLLGKQGEINAIQALECNCASIDRLGEIRAELLQILPGTRIIETQSTALARAEARVKAKALSDEKIAAAQAQRQRMREQRAGFIATVVPLVAVFSMGVVALIALQNVRERVHELGVLRAVGVRRIKLLAVFLLRAVLAGLVGALLALLLAWVVIDGSAVTLFSGNRLLSLFDRGEIVLVMLAAPIFAALAAWLPALLAAVKDPAAVLRID